MFHPPTFEMLEKRRLLAVSVALDGKELNITGTNQPEQVIVSVEGWALKIRALTGTGPLYTSDQVQQWQFHTLLVKSLDVRLGGSDDRFEATLYSLPVDVTVRGGGGNDDIRCYTGGAKVLAYGDDGDDVVRVSYGYLGSSTIYGGDGDDYLRGGLWDDKIYGQYGNDMVVGRDGSDWLYGDNILDWSPWLCGNDTIVGGFGYDRMYGGPGDDLLAKWFDLSPWGDQLYAGDGGEMYGGIGNDVLDAFAGFPIGGTKLYGGYGNDLLIGSEYGDILDGGFGNDTMRGNAGDDTYFADDGYQDLIEHTIGGGNDTIFNDDDDILV